MHQVLDWLRDAGSQPIAIILSSGVLAAIIAGLFQLRGRSSDYRNEFFKLVIQRRLAAYEALEELISALKASVVDSENDPTHPYHLLFAEQTEETVLRAHVLLHSVMSKGLWLTDPVFDKLRELNELLYKLTESTEVIAFGKKHYQAIALLRANLESLVARDMLTMHDVRGFLRSKRKPSTEFLPFYAGGKKEHSASAGSHS